MDIDPNVLLGIATVSLTVLIPTITFLLRLNNTVVKLQTDMAWMKQTLSRKNGGEKTE